MKKFGILAFSLLVILSVLSLFFNGSPVAGDTSAINTGDTAWLLTATGLVLLMTPGLSFFYGGMVQSKNVISTMFQSFIAMGVVSILWVVFGFSLAFGESINGIIGNPLTFLFFKNVGASPNPDFAPTIPFLLFAMFQLKFAIITPALITGSFAERVSFKAYLLFMVLFSIFIYAPLAHMTWHPDGILRQMGVLDFAGGTVVHMSAGYAALAGALILGRRKIHIENQKHEPANIPYVLLGTGLIWFGWFGFNAGSALSANATAAMAFATTTVASASAMLTWIFFDRLHGRKVSALGACVGAVVGLVAITPAAGFISIPQSIFFGFIAAIVSNKMLHWKKLKSIDDTLDVFACHGVGGIMGMILTAIFAEGENASLLHGGWSVFGHHMAALILVAGFTFFGSIILYKITNFIIPLRVSEESENIGLDLSQHDEKF